MKRFTQEWREGHIGIIKSMDQTPTFAKPADFQ